ncbi:hypothetical protein N181_13125 [Sinorhizobium fredii USDA 205]|uniref:Uncharacterized protein n=1 Tax=Sinorhizobium glycinis TaxID=1472378 RepID=A0A178XJY2_9HYPH|nr:hypothetical protein N181_13125 [Sinorhizobium fredii USDA 205]OAP35549.1 hypothetical protein AU381_11550 [Sinorhizobium glycinis]GEC31556.1 hypothetical protein EFR01_17270 [Sinorhizobium fredii]GLS07145.1 hypothetical protein GCM10007864_07710 [Sinorhizobium fredii]
MESTAFGPDGSGRAGGDAVGKNLAGVASRSFRAAVDSDVLDREVREPLAVRRHMVVRAFNSDDDPRDPGRDEALSLARFGGPSPNAALLSPLRAARPTAMDRGTARPNGSCVAPGSRLIDVL